LIERIRSSLLEAKAALDSLLDNDPALSCIERAARVLVETLERRGRVYACGNGGSMCDAMHFAEEMTGRYRHNRPGLAVIAISDPSHLTCVGNDFGYESVFSRFVESHGREGDCLLAISTSGRSANVVNAARTARALGLSVIALTGRNVSTILRQSRFEFKLGRLALSAVD
jgi:D-sedoheptulose 7-phosphate isomerase